jgi:hypothetical protein
MALTHENAQTLARLPLAGLLREYPHADVHVMNGPADARTPRELHPAFFGCFDWHSSVHGHWALARLSREFEIPGAREAMRQTLTAENVEAEVAYFEAPNRQAFERMYGWAWLLKLATELRSWDDRDGRAWAANLRPLEELIVQRYLEFLPKQTYPIRVGNHSNTAFGLTFALDYAGAMGRTELKSVIEERSRSYFGKDEDYPAHLEPGGADFLSPCLVEADLMRRVLPAEEFATWLRRFLPHGLPSSLRTPAYVSDRRDGQIGHLDGLNLSRAWCLAGLSSFGDEYTEAADVHREEGLRNVATGDYMGEHWLATFAVYLLDH